MSRGEHARDDAAAQTETLRHLKQQPAAILIGWTPRGLRDADPPRNKDGTYDATALVKWLIEKKNAGADPDPFMNGSNSPALERYRVARAIAQERENERLSGTLLDFEEMKRETAQVFKGLGERLEPICRNFPGEVATAIQSAFRDFVKSWESRVTKKPVARKKRGASA